MKGKEFVDANQKILDAAHSINQNAVRALDVENDIGIVHKYSTEKELTLNNPEITDIQNIISFAIDHYQDEIEEREIEVKVEVPPNVPVKISCDYDKMKIAIWQMVHNSICYIPLKKDPWIGERKVTISMEIVKTAKTPEPKILASTTSKLTASEYKLLIRFKDTGIGIEEDFIPKVFNVFGHHQRSPRANVYPNAGGLGLYISGKGITLHGGRIYLEETAINRGSTFVIELPIPTEVVEGKIKNENKA